MADGSIRSSIAQASIDATAANTSRIISLFCRRAFAARSPTRLLPPLGRQAASRSSAWVSPIGKAGGDMARPVDHRRWRTGSTFMRKS